MSQRSTPEGRPARVLPEPEEWVDRYGDALYRYALSRLRRPDEAEEAVQDALLTALKARGTFQGRSHPQTWLMGILKHKVQSRRRNAARARPSLSVDELEVWFDERGKWRRCSLSRWRPDDLVERQDFWRVVRGCLARLPARMAEAFTLRTLDDRAPAEVCRDLSISPANLWVLLHRARLRLVHCLQRRWFDAGD
jgi:RNA polymerase sigma-70 factor (ECF subfamily)